MKIITQHNGTFAQTVSEDQVVIQLSAQFINAFLKLIKLGELTSLEENAKVAAKLVADQYQAILGKYKNTEVIKTFYQLWHDPLRTVGSNNWTESLISDCNGSNIFNDATSDYPVVSLESVLQKDPQVIIIPHHSGRKKIKKHSGKTGKISEQ